MTDNDWREVERQWQINPQDYELFKRMLAARRRSGNLMEVESCEGGEILQPTLRDLVIAEMDSLEQGGTGFQAYTLSGIYFDTRQEKFKAVTDARKTGLNYWLSLDPEFLFGPHHSVNRARDEQVLLALLQGDALLVRYFAEELEQPLSMTVRRPSILQDTFHCIEFSKGAGHYVISNSRIVEKLIKVKTYSAWKPPGYKPKK